MAAFESLLKLASPGRGAADWSYQLLAAICQPLGQYVACSESQGSLGWCGEGAFIATLFWIGSSAWFLWIASQRIADSYSAAAMSLYGWVVIDIIGLAPSLFTAWLAQAHLSRSDLNGLFVAFGSTLVWGFITSKIIAHLVKVKNA